MKKHSILARVGAMALMVAIVGAITCVAARPAYALTRVLEINAKFEQPRAGHAPDMAGSLSTIPTRGGCRICNVSWNTSDQKFQVGKRYTVSFTVKADSDYSILESTPVRVNGRNADWRFCGTSREIRVSYTFDAVPGIPDDDE